MKNGPYELIVPPDDYPGKRYRGRYAYEHRVTWWKKTGKNPDDFPMHFIHHANESRRDNDENNLHLMDKGEHQRHHNKNRAMPLDNRSCRHCGDAFQCKSYSPKQFCSLRCVGLYNYPARYSQTHSI